MKHSDSIKDISGALAKAQSEMGRVLRDKTAKVQTKTGGSYSFDYADLASVLDVVKPALTKHGIAVIQGVSTEAAAVIVETRLVHESGEWIESALTLKPDDMAPQKVGSAITYARRYALSSMVGVASEEDDDANAAEGNSRQIEPRHANGTGHAQTQTAKVKERVAAMREQVRDPKARKEAALKAFVRLGYTDDGVRADLATILGRTFPQGKDITLMNEHELEQLEARVAHLEATAKHGSDAQYAQ